MSDRVSGVPAPQEDSAAGDEDVLWPWPDEPTEVPAKHEEFKGIRTAALREVGVEPTKRYRYPLSAAAALARAQAIAFDSVGISYQWVPVDEYRESLAAVGKGNRKGFMKRRSWFSTDGGAPCGAGPLNPSPNEERTP